MLIFHAHDDKTNRKIAHPFDHTLDSMICEDRDLLIKHTRADAQESDSRAIYSAFDFDYFFVFFDPETRRFYARQCQSDGYMNFLGDYATAKEAIIAVTEVILIDNENFDDLAE